ncbi:MAG TPA: hypothetical protein VMT49_06555 [Steroidobacteraceae bacterium]|nr:hypothetical protein [Steroidobacteraceae bacterium]
MGYGLDSEVAADELDQLLATLDRRYRSASEAANAARAELWALRHEADTPLQELESTERQWQRLEIRRRELAGQIESLQS